MEINDMLKYMAENQELNTLQIVALQMMPLCVNLTDCTIEQKVKESYRLAELFLELGNER